MSFPELFSIYLLTTLILLLPSGHSKTFTSTLTSKYITISMSNVSPCKKVLVIGGSGRVGGSTVRALKKYYCASYHSEKCSPNTEQRLEIIVGGRNKSAFERSLQRWKKINSHENYDDIKFCEVDISLSESVRDALHGCDLVVHTAGPFQRKSTTVLEAAIETGVQYCDVCDDADVAKRAKFFHERAKDSNVSAVVSAGIWPGLDQLMAMSCCDAIGGYSNVKSVEFNAYTAGTGNAGTTILSATFLILSEMVLAYRDGKSVLFHSATDFKKVYFGDIIGQKTVFRMNMIESMTCHEVTGIPNIDTFFGTAPEIWNYLLVLITFIPKFLLRNPDLMQLFAKFSEPIVRITDQFVGSWNAMKVTAESFQGERVEMFYAHKDLEECVGIATAAFAASILRGDVEHGVWFPEEALSYSWSREKFFDEATRGCVLWKIEKK